MMMMQELGGMFELLYSQFGSLRLWVRFVTTTLEQFTRDSVKQNSKQKVDASINDEATAHVMTAFRKAFDDRKMHAAQRDRFRAFVKELATLAAIQLLIIATLICMQIVLFVRWLKSLFTEQDKI